MTKYTIKYKDKYLSHSNYKYQYTSSIFKAFIFGSFSEAKALLEEGERVVPVDVEIKEK